MVCIFYVLKHLLVNHATEGRRRTYRAHGSINAYCSSNCHVDIICEEQKKNNEELRKYIEVEELSNKKTQADYIKSQQIIAEEKRRAIELEKKNKIKEELERKIAEEEERIQIAEGKKQQLEQEEIEIMKKLKTTTQMHEQMVENYEKLNNKK